MKTSEQILEEIQLAMALNKNAKTACNTALTDAMSLIMHKEKELQNLLDAEYKRGMNDAWEIARELHSDYDEFTNIFGKEPTIGYVIQNSSPLEVKKKITSYREEKEKVHAGDVIQNNDDGTKATILDFDVDTSLEDEQYWMVFTENGCVETWCQDDFIKTGESIDIHNALIK